MLNIFWILWIGLERRTYKQASLPRKIHNKIYLAVLQTPSPPPASPKDVGLRSTRDLYRVQLITSVHYPNFPIFRYASQNLFACNHQIKAEEHEVLARPTSRGLGGLDFKLDVMVQGGVYLPT